MDEQSILGFPRPHLPLYVLQIQSHYHRLHQKRRRVMHFKYIFSLIALVISVGATLVVIGESKMNTVDRQKMFDKRPLKIMRDDKYLHNRSREMELAIKAGAVITNEKIEMILHEWLISVERRNGNEEASLIHFTPDMLSEENKDKFNKSILGIGINREEVIDKLKALNIAIDHSSEKITQKTKDNQTLINKNQPFIILVSY